MTRKPTESEVQDVLQDVEDLAQSIGMQTHGLSAGQTGDGAQAYVLELQNAVQGTRVVGSPDWPFIVVESSYDVSQELAANKKLAKTDGGIQVESVEIDETDVKSARQELRDRAQSDLGEIRNDLVGRISIDDLAVELNADEEFVTGFKVDDKLFPYEDGLADQEVFNSLQRIASVIFSGRELLIHEYDVRNAVDADNHGPRGFE